MSGQPGAGAVPATGAGAVPTRTTTGATHIDDPGAGYELSLERLALAAAQTGTDFCLYDRLVHTSGLSGTIATPQAVNTVAITRPDALGDDVELFLEVYTATGSTPANVTASYTNEGGTAGRTTPSIAFPVSPVAGTLLRLPLQDGDLGVRSVESVTLSGSTGTAGNFGVTLIRTISLLTLEDLALSRPRVPGQACLAGYVVPISTDTGIIVAQVTLKRVET